jgi:hypothetical protein
MTYTYPCLNCTCTGPGVTGGDIMTCLGCWCNLRKCYCESSNQGECEQNNIEDELCKNQ